MKKLGIIFLGLAIVVGALSIWQIENITAFVNAQKYTKAEILENQEIKKNEFQEKLHSEIQNPIRDFTKEELELINQGTATPEEIVKKIKQEAGLAASEITTTNNTPVSTKTKEEVINSALGELYALKANMNGQLRGLMDAGKSEYLALPPEQRGNQAKTSIVKKYIGMGMSLEGSSDQAINTVLDNLKSELKNIGEDTSIVETMRGAYESEKSAQKSFYLSLTQ